MRGFKKVCRNTRKGNQLVFALALVQNLKDRVKYLEETVIQLEQYVKNLEIRLQILECHSYIVPAQSNSKVVPTDLKNQQIAKKPAPFL